MNNDFQAFAKSVLSTVTSPEVGGTAGSSPSVDEKTDRLEYFRLLDQLAGMAMPPEILSSGRYWNCRFEPDYLDGIVTVTWREQQDRIVRDSDPERRREVAGERALAICRALESFE